MKRKLMSGIMAAVMLCCLTLTTAFAANETSGQTNITYSVEIPDGYYEVEIPTTVDINNSNALLIDAGIVNIADNQILTVSIDTDRTYILDGHFYLTNRFSNRIKIDIYKYNRNTGTQENLDSIRNPMIASFTKNNLISDTYLIMEPVIATNTQPGDYSGLLYFNIAIENN